MITEDIIDRNNPQRLIIDPKHPGINDNNYVQRREMFFNLARDYRLNKNSIPLIEYTPEENEIWRHINSELNAVHRARASEIYLHGKKVLQLNTEQMPQLKLLSEKLPHVPAIGIVPAEGLLSPHSFFYYLSKRTMPCTQFLRHHSNPEYTPEPDAVHDVIGHVPPLLNSQYTDIVQLLGEGVNQAANDEQLAAWNRVYWFTIEFGLLQEGREVKVFGAGLLSSFGEMKYCYSDNVERRPFSIWEVIETDYDPTRMQDIIFVIPSLNDLKAQMLELIKKFKADNL